MSHPPLEDPRAASRRRYLRGNLPAVYHQNPDGRPLPVMGLLEGLERVLDPVVVLLDNLGAHVDPATGPADMVDFLTGLLGAPIDDTLPVQARRALAMAAPHIARVRGTQAGLQTALSCTLPDLEPRVRDDGRATWRRDAKAAPDASTPASFEVRLARNPSPGQAAQLARCIADHLPVGTTYSFGVER